MHESIVRACLSQSFLIEHNILTINENPTTYCTQRKLQLYKKKREKKLCLYAYVPICLHAYMSIGLYLDSSGIIIANN